MPVTITVPEKISAGFVVATDQDPGDIPVAIKRALPGSLMEAIAERIGTPRLTIAGYRADDSPWDLHRVESVNEEDVIEIEQATHHIGVLCVLPAAHLPFGLHLARVTATAIAESVGGVPADLDTGQVVPPLLRSENLDDFVLAHDWIGVPPPSYWYADRCTAGEDDIDACACVDLVTRGLRRFGLPELEIRGVACAHGIAALNLLRATAQRLLPLGTRPGEHTLPSELPLTSGDFSAYWGGRAHLWDDGPVPVRLIQVAPHRLGLVPPVKFPGTLNEWLWDDLPPALYELVTWYPDAPFHST